jgi:hypothetical protein
VVKEFLVKRHTVVSIGKGERLEYFFVLSPSALTGGEEWLDFPLLDIIVTLIFHFKKALSS